MNLYEKENVTKSDKTCTPFTHYFKEDLIKSDKTDTNFKNYLSNAKTTYRVHNNPNTPKVEEVVPSDLRRSAMSPVEEVVPSDLRRSAMRPVEEVVPSDLRRSAMRPVEEVVPSDLRRSSMRPTYASHVYIPSRENAIHCNENTEHDYANTKVYPTSPVTKTRSLNAPVFASFEQENVSRTKTHLTVRGNTIFDKKINDVNNYKPYISANTVNGKVAGSNLTRVSDFQYMDRSSPDNTSVIDIPESHDRMESKYNGHKVPLEESSTDRTWPLPTPVSESYVHVINKLVRTYLPPPKPMIPCYDGYPHVEMKPIPRNDNFNHYSPDTTHVRERRSITNEFPGSTRGEVLNQLAWDKINHNIPFGDEENSTDSINKHQILHKIEGHKLSHTTTHPIKKYSVGSTDITTSQSDLENHALDNENSLSLNAFGVQNILNFDEIDTHEDGELDGLASHKNGTENNRTDTENDSITLKSLSSLRRPIKEKSDGATNSYSTKTQVSHLFVDKPNSIVPETINKPHSPNNIMDRKCTPSDNQPKPPNIHQEQPKPHHLVGRKKDFNQINQGLRSSAHAFGDVNRRFKTSPTSYVNQSHQCKNYSPPHRHHFVHPKNTYEDSQYNDRLSQLQTPSKQRPSIQGHPEHSGANSQWRDDKYHTQNDNYRTEHWMEGLRSSATEIPPWTFDPSPHVQARVPYWNNNLYPLRYSSGEAHPQMTMPGSSSPLFHGSPRSDAPTQSLSPPSFNTSPYPGNDWMGPSKGDQSIPDRYESSPLKYNPSFSPEEAYNEKRGFSHGIYWNQRHKPYQTKHVFTGWAGYNWPTIQKPEPTNKKDEEENMPVYTKPSVRRSFFANDEIEKALQKYTSRLKKDIYKNKNEGNSGEDLDRPTLNSPVQENIYPETVN